MIDDNQSGSAEVDILEDKTLEDEVENYLENNMETKRPGLKVTLLAGLLAGLFGLGGAAAGVYLSLIHLTVIVINRITEDMFVRSVS